MEAILHYLFSLGKRLVFLALACFLAPIVLVSLGYSRETAFAVYLAVLACSLPWLLWFQQMYYLGIGRSPRGFVHIRTAFFSSLFCTVLIFILFPFIPSSGIFSLNAAPPMPSLSEAPILSFPEGALVLNPSKTFPTAGVPAEVKAIWLGGRTLYFTNIATNGETLSLGGTENIQVPFRKDYPQLNSSLLGRRAASLWLDNMLGFHRTLQELSIGYGAGYPLHKNTAFARVFYQGDAPAPSTSRPEAYPRLFLTVFSLYLFACLLGILFSLRQHYLGSLCLILAVSLWGSVFIMNQLLKISALIPIPYAFEAGLGLASLFLIGLLCGFGFHFGSFPKFQKAAKK